MGSLHFHLGFVEALADHRMPILTYFFQGITAMGSADFYVLLIMLAYVAWDKRIAVRLSYLVLITMASNDLLKNLIRNPRPFVGDGTYTQRWAVTPAQAGSLAAEYSTPSGHAMAAGSFYSYLYFAAQRTWVRVGAVLLILLIGFSRPYLGVHYGEDVLLGWAAGLAIAFIAMRYGQAMESWWGERSYGLQVAATFAASLAICVISVALNGWKLNGHLNGMMAYTGFLTGNVIACPLEKRFVRFDVRGGAAHEKFMRFMIAAGLISVLLVALKLAIAFLGLADSTWRFVLEYVGYAAAGVGGMFVAPWMFLRIGLADRETAVDVNRADEDAESERALEA